MPWGSNPQLVQTPIGSDPQLDPNPQLNKNVKYIQSPIGVLSHKPHMCPASTGSSHGGLPDQFFLGC